MEEQILKIIKTNQIFLQGHCEKAAKEITEHVFEFIKWIVKEDVFFEHKDYWLKCDESDHQTKKHYTIEEVYQYWLKEVKK
jgi:hypothetical protein